MRLALALVLGLFIAISMFLGMHFMISGNNKMLERTKNVERLVYLREKQMKQ